MVKNIKYDKKGDKGKARKYGKPPPRVKGSQREDEEIAALKLGYEQTKSPSDITSFRDLPLSKKTLRGLKECGYKVPTDIQKEAVLSALQGKDVLGSALTGSGKTLAFLIPILENLYINKWTRLDGVGAVVITPTRELAYQIFETLKKVGQFHDFSAGLIIGGKNLKFEKSRMDQCNIIICTPGRLLQHMDENPVFTCDQMKILVLDEADRCLDMGFEVAMNAIIENFPPERQTLLFSATQTKSVKDLARLSLNEPNYIAPHEQQAGFSGNATPVLLKHSYIECNLEDKVTMLWSFLKQHKKAKIIVFMSSCKQVKYIFEIFSKLRPGISLLALYGTLSQDRRVNVYNEFCTKSNIVLFATDIASRGLDFPEVSWVVQMDCPEDVVAYIHRAGRTARFKATGENLLVLMPSEKEGMLKELKNRQINVDEIHIDARYLFSPRVKMESFLAQKKELKDTAQRAFVAYIKSVVLMKNKEIFKVDDLNVDAYARSLGLVVTPRVRFLDRMKKRQKPKTNPSKLNSIENNKSIENPSTTFTAINSDESDGDEDDFVTIKRRDHEIEVPEDDTPLEQPESRKKLSKTTSKASVAKKIIKKKIVANTKISFDEEGEAVRDATKVLQSELGKTYGDDDGEEDREGGGINIEKAKRLMQEEDKFDKKRFKELVKARRKERKKKLKDKSKREEESEGEDGGQAQDDFGSDEEGSEPDLSWLPDPDKIYGKKKIDSDENDSRDDDEEEEELHRPPQKLVEKRKRDPSDEYGLEEKLVKKKKKKQQIVEDLTLDEAEKLALKLLSN